MKPYRLTPVARRDLIGIWQYIARDSVRYADRVEEAIYRSCANAAAMPLIGKERTDLTHKRLRFLPALPYANYVVVYDPQSAPLSVVRILHGAMDLRTRF
ncbi:hypothetical protein GCM10011507_14740 [Edaphobacter acidisoli]|uniref:Toxin n=1 Tax=Edaphobacter acidisoli TaxID=2040573 RepID=A0A916RPJ1_9BACT|nr:hypothetical protein GCM10011507_14740 [Edaphobacter acidisoli]